MVGSNLPPSPTKNDDTNTRKDDTPKWKKFLEGAAVLIALGILIVNTFQSCANKKAADAATSAAETAYRGLVVTERAWLQITTDDNGIRNFNELQPLESSKSIRVTNVGKTAARNIRVCGGIQIVPSNKSPDFTNADVCESPKYLPAGTSYCFSDTTGVLFPNAPPIVNDNCMAPHGTTMSHTQYVALQEGRAYIAIYALVAYDDIFGVKHWTRTCGFQAMVNGATYHASQCTAWNDVDSDK